MSCKGCWWEEGGLCYLSPVWRSSDGRSVKKASIKCSHFTGKREALESVIPGENLVILSEGGRDE